MVSSYIDELAILKNDSFAETIPVEDFIHIIIYKISKNRRNIYSFIHIHTNTSD